MPKLTSKVGSRSDLARHLSDAMELSHVKFQKKGRQEVERNLLKSYLVEFHNEDHNEDHKEDHLAVGARELQRAAKGVRGSCTLTDDPSLVVIVSPRLQAEFYVDILHPRYWILHTLSGSDHADRMLAYLIKTTPAIDRAWFPSRLLEDAASLGRFEGFGVRFDSTLYYTDEMDGLMHQEDEGEWSPLDNRLLTFSLRTPRGVRKQLQRLREMKFFPYASSLSWVRVRLSGAKGDAFALEDITYHGKFTARGTSFTDHQIMLSEMRDRYSAAVGHLESRAAIGSVEVRDGLRIEGEPLILHFSEPIRHLHEVIPRMFTSAEPYRFWGVPQRANERLVRVHAVDLHIGHQLTLDITPADMTAYLPKGTCGNTITRLYSNIQRTLDPGVTLRGEETWLAPQQAI